MKTLGLLLAAEHTMGNYGLSQKEGVVFTVKTLQKIGMEGKVDSYMPKQNKAKLDYSEKAMATHSSTLAWKILWVEESGGL